MFGLEIGGQRVPQVDFHAFLAADAERVGLYEADSILGNDLLSRYKVSLDFDNLRLKLE